jgi:hypothetical protein
MSPEEALQRCANSMQAVAVTQQAAHASATVRKRQSAAGELRDYLDAFPMEWNVTLQTCGPEHVLQYAVDHFLVQHVGEWPPAGVEILGNPQAHVPGQ